MKTIGRFLSVFSLLAILAACAPAENANAIVQPTQTPETVQTTNGLGCIPPLEGQPYSRHQLGSRPGVVVLTKDDGIHVVVDNYNHLADNQIVMDYIEVTCDTYDQAYAGAQSLANRLKLENQQSKVYGPDELEVQISVVTATPDDCGFGPIDEGTLMYEAKHISGTLYQLTGNTKLAKDGEYCESGLGYNIDDVDGSFLGAYGYGFVHGSVEHEPDIIWIVGHNSN